jgi:hypothetical protein
MPPFSIVNREPSVFRLSHTKYPDDREARSHEGGGSGAETDPHGHHGGIL